MTTIYHPNVNTVVPWQANYSYPSQATQTHKQVVKIQPQGPQEITSSEGKKIIFQMPSDGYLNARNSVYSFTVQIPHFGSSASQKVWVTRAVLTVTDATNTDVVAVSGQSFALSNWDTVNAPTHFTAGVPAAADLYGATLHILSGASAGTFITLPDSTGITLNSGVASWTRNSSAGSPAGVQTVPPGKYIVVLSSHGIELGSAGIHSLFRRITDRYGGLVLQDVQEYGTLSKLLLKGGASRDYAESVGNVTEGFRSDASYSSYAKDSAATPNGFGVTTLSIPAEVSGQTQWVNVAEGIQRTFVFNLLCGLATTEKLIPLKWMASSLRTEFELASVKEAFIMRGKPDQLSSFLSYKILTPTYVAELMEFDSVYDTAFFMGMQQMGVPLKFTSWHHQRRQITGTGRQQFPIQESARSVKAAFSVITDLSPSLLKDHFTFYHDAGIKINPDTGLSDVTQSAKVRNYQWRVGGKYAPAQPVDCRYGAAEAYHEYAKAINTCGNYTFGSGITPISWSSEFPGSSVGEDFVMSSEFENTDVFPNTITGINAENQSDMMLAVEFGRESGTAALDSSDKVLDTFISFDNLLIVREGHLVDLIA